MEHLLYALDVVLPEICNCLEIMRELLRVSHDMDIPRASATELPAQPYVIEIAVDE